MYQPTMEITLAPWTMLLSHLNYIVIISNLVISYSNLRSYVNAQKEKKVNAFEFVFSKNKINIVLYVKL